jgi:alkanesulfonate monooxygenase SsuD/methylene tetrahydromethanopterin reductase-like flavin-dependent oxidoreductase (luciferase family)
MELGIYHEFPVLPGRSQAECFAAGFDIVDAAEEYGLDVMWLAELHFAPQRALAASPLTAPRCIKPASITTTANIAAFIGCL